MSEHVIIRPDLYVLILDETKYWTESVVKIAKKMFGIYVYDANVHVHCCELTPSYEAYWIRDDPQCVPDDEDAREKFETLIREALRGDDIQYFHTSTIDRLPELAEKAPRLKHSCRYRLGDRNPDEEYSEELSNQQIEEVIEYLQANEWC